MKKSYTVDTYKDGVLELTDAYDNGETIIALAKDCVIYSIRKDGDKVVKEDKGLEYAAVTSMRQTPSTWIGTTRTTTARIRSLLSTLLRRTTTNPNLF